MQKILSMPREKKEKTENSELNISELIIDAIKAKNGEDITLIELGGVPNSLFDTFVLCTAQSNIQADSITEEIVFSIKKLSGLRPINVEGKANMEWILIDYFDTIVHIFLPETREFYKLEQLWADANIKKIN